MTPESSAGEVVALAAIAGANGRSRCAPLRVPGRLFVELLESHDQLLDPGVIGEDLGGAGELAAEQAAQDRIEEQHRVGAERAIRPARLEEVDGRTRQAAQLDLAGDLLDELVALLLGRLVREAHAIPCGVAPSASDAVAAMAASNASYTAAPRIAKMTCWMVVDF